MSHSSKERRKKHGGAHEDPLDLDVTPFLNIMFMLILSILAMTSWTQLAMLNVQAPQIGGGSTGGDAGSKDTPPPSNLNLTVFVLRTGFNIGATGATFDGNRDGRPGQPLVPKIQVQKGGKMVSEYDFDTLQKELIKIKQTFKAEQAMIISADADVNYDVIVHVMDAARKTSDGALLFPQVAFAAGIVG